MNVIRKENCMLLDLNRRNLGGISYLLFRLSGRIPENGN